MGVQPEDQLLLVQPEDQLFLVQPEDQLLLVQPEDQLLLVQPEAPLQAQLFLLQQLRLLPQLQHLEVADEIKGRKISNSVYWLEYSIASINEYYLSCILFPHLH